MDVHVSGGTRISGSPGATAGSRYVGAVKLLPWLSTQDPTRDRGPRTVSAEPQFGTSGYEPLRGVVWSREEKGPLSVLCWPPSCRNLDWRWLDSGLTVRRATELYPSTGVDE
jgi:hypothetical protein